MKILARGRGAFTAAVFTAAAAVLMGAAGLVAGSGPTARAAAQAVVLSEGDIDLTPRLVDGKPQLQIDDRTGAQPVVREPSQVVWHVVPEAMADNYSPLYPLIGEGLYAWFLNHLWTTDIFALEPGWNGTQAGGDTEVRLAGFEGPGAFALYTYTREMDDSNGNPTPHLSSTDPAYASFTLGKDAQRTQPSWAFTAEGVYRLTFAITSGGATDTETLAVVVGDDVDPATVLPGDGTAPTASPTDSGSATPTGSPTSTAPGALVIDDGHVDLAARKADGELSFQVKEGSELDHAWHEPDEVVMHVVPAARRKITSGTTFLGKEGDPVWWLPSSYISGIVWPGWNTQEWKESELDGRVTHRLDSVQGPGNLYVFNNGGLGSHTMWFNSADGLPDPHEHSVGSHSHTEWVFTQEGVYRTAFTVSATLADGTKVSDTATLAWVVGDDVDPKTVTPGAGDEPTASPTATASASVPASPSASASAPVTTAPTASGSATATATATASASAPPAGTPGGSGGSSTAGGTVTTGGLASTGAGVTVIAAVATLALLAGGGAVFAVRRRRTAQ
ncbi:choice-of-anchor M domain-containing protein [Streptomyces sp. NPDC058335]|uniref:choice-of-anchor M domain-containing protein n=1 Tax=Streptomyces sp. NPDC058335 TaxID=3346451 RepID=UPI00364B8591